MILKLFNWFKKNKKHEPLGTDAVVEFVVDGGYSVRAQLNTFSCVWHVTVYMYDTVVAKEEIDAKYNCPERRTFAFLEETYDKDHLEKLVRKKAWLRAARVPECLWNRAVSASDDFLVLRAVGDCQSLKYRIYPRTAKGDINPVLKFKEFYVSWGCIQGPKDFPPEKINEKWEEWPYPNECEV